MEKNYEFRVGDKVKILKGSEYYAGTENNPKDITGTVIRIDEECKHPIYVVWGNGWGNCYRDYDLELVTEEPSNEEQNVNIQHKDDVRSIRDRIYQIREQIASLETEQKNLIEILDKEGFILKDFAVESPIPIPEGVDVNDWRTWKVGDLVDMVEGHNDLQQGKLYPITDIEDRLYEGNLPVEVQQAWPLSSQYRWHSRPTD